MTASSAVDKNQRELVACFRRFGASVFLLHKVGGGCPDLLVGYRGITLLVEIKTAKGKLRDTQKRFIATWKGLKPTVVRSRKDVIDLLRKTRGTK